MAKIRELKEPANTCDTTGCDRTATHSIRKTNYMVFFCCQCARKEQQAGEEVRPIFRKYPGVNGK